MLRMHSEAPSPPPLAVRYTASLIPENVLVLFCSIQYPTTRFQQFRSHGGKWGRPQKSDEGEPGSWNILLHNLVMGIYSCSKEVPRPFGTMTGFLKPKPLLSIFIISETLQAHEKLICVWFSLPNDILLFTQVTSRYF